MINIHVETLGCRLNQIESEAAAKFFLDRNIQVKMGGLNSQLPEQSDILLSIINTCTVTQKSEQKARRLIRLMLKKFPNAAILVTGCYAQLSGNEIKAIDKRICVIGGQIKSRIQIIPDLLLKAAQNQFNPIEFAAQVNSLIENNKPVKIDYPENSFALSTSSFIAHSRASIKIQDGCNSNCSYCAIHMARGHSVSLPVNMALERVKELEEKNQSEVIITTVNIGQYKSEYNGEVFNFTKLLRLLLEETKSINFRISSLYPEVVTEEFCEVIKNPRVRPHFHISVQSGSNNILKAMNRAYKADTVINACKSLRMAKPDCFLACDVITGFPGETDKDFQDTMDLCKACDFTWVHAFPYSERKGTAAAVMKNKVPNEISGNRSKEISEWAAKNKIEYIKKFQNKDVFAIIETVKKPLISNILNNTQNLVYHAVTENFLHCEIHAKELITMNQQVKIRILKPLEDKINKGGEIEALAEIVKS